MVSFVAQIEQPHLRRALEQGNLCPRAGWWQLIPIAEQSVSVQGVSSGGTEGDPALLCRAATCGRDQSFNAKCFRGI